MNRYKRETGKKYQPPEIIPPIQHYCRMDVAIEAAFHDKRYESVMRKHGGPMEHHAHRFPIKGGISLREVMVREATKTNALLSFFMREQKDDTS